MKKVYIVTEEFGGFVEDSYSDVIGVCSTEELAEKLVKISGEYHNREISISEEQWDELENEVCNYQSENEDSKESDVEIMHKLYPELSIEDLKEAYDRYTFVNDYAFTSITKADAYESEEDLNNYYKKKSNGN